MNSKNQVKVRIERGDKITKLIVPHEDREIAFAYPPLGPGSYQEVGKQILEHNLAIPTAEEIASLLHAACISDFVPEFRKIREIMRDNWLLVFNRKLWTGKGVYTIFDPMVKGLSEKLDINELEKMLIGGNEIKENGVRISEDGMIRFAPKSSYKFGKHTPNLFVKDGNIISEYGIEGAKKLVKSSISNPYVLGLDITEDETPELGVSSFKYEGSSFQLYIYGHAILGMDWHSYSFGMIK